jgi:hypothetical protein
MKAVGIVAFAAIVVTVCSVLLGASAGQRGTTPAADKEVKPAAAAEAKLSDIPGITTPDRTPHACVDCHVNRPEANADYRLPTILAKWKDAVDPEILQKAKAAAPEGKVLAGKHPDVATRIKTIPDDCLKCHGRNSQSAPPFAKLLHAIHLVGGQQNHFLTIANGTCTSCHKLDQKTGAWHLGSGEAK